MVPPPLTIEAHLEQPGDFEQGSKRLCRTLNICTTRGVIPIVVRLSTERRQGKAFLGNVYIALQGASWGWGGGKKTTPKQNLLLK